MSSSLPSASARSGHRGRSSSELGCSQPRGVFAATAFDPDKDIAAHMTAIIIEPSACQPLATAGVGVASNGSASTAPIQYP